MLITIPLQLPADPAAQRSVRRGRAWRTVASDLGLNILWTVDANGLYHAHWEVPLGAAAGRYRFVIPANRYGLKSRPFAVRRSRGLARAFAPP